MLGNSDWLFKFPKARKGGDEEKRKAGAQLQLDEITGMHWSEKVAYELSREFKILSPRVELAMLNGNIGSITENFAHEGYTLYHGNQVLANTQPEYDADKRHHQNDHKMSSIMEAIEDIFSNKSAGEAAKQKFVDYLIFDALICNVDRHHENWGFLRKLTPEGDYKGRLAPSYDHASSLGRELVDKHDDNPNKRSRYSLLKDPEGVKRYALAGHGPIYVEGVGKKGRSPIKLVERCFEFEEFCDYFTESLHKLDHLNVEKFQSIVAKIPDAYMSPLAKEFVNKLLCVNLNLLNDLRDSTN